MEDQDRSRLQESCFQRDVYVVSDASFIVHYRQSACNIVFKKRKWKSVVLYYNRKMYVRPHVLSNTLSDRLYISISLFNRDFRADSPGSLLLAEKRLSFSSLWRRRPLCFWMKLDIDGWAFEVLHLCCRDVDEVDQKKRLLLTVWNRNRTSR